MQKKMATPVKNYSRYRLSNEQKVFARTKKLIGARPKEHVNPAARDKSVIGTCNR